MLTLLVVACAAGCGEIELKNQTVKRTDEPISAGDVRAFVEIVRNMPGKRLPNLPPLFLPPPDWNPERTLPVSDLVDSELLALDERWDYEPLVHLLPDSRQFDRWLLRKRMTREQFAGMTLVIAAALSRSTVRPDQDLNEIIARGEATRNELRKLNVPFNSLSPAMMHEVLHRAAWLTRYDRARRLAAVPTENVRAVLNYWEQLEPLFPASVTENPFDSITDRLEEEGVPFEELPGGESLDVLTWDRATAIVGRDEPVMQP
ncbi:hypothetical protein GC176_21150 [bacterium]|nr:hypothetical protein [bacterium]